MADDENGGWFATLQENLSRQFTDIKNIEIITAVADEVSLVEPVLTDMEKLKEIRLTQMSYYSRTTMQIDGDNYTLLPSGKDPSKVEQVQKLHENHVGAAVVNWNHMVKIAFTGLLLAGTIAGGISAEKFRDAKELVQSFGLVTKA